MSFVLLNSFSGQDDDSSQPHGRSRGALVPAGEDRMSKGELLELTASMVLAPEAPLDQFVSWLRFYVDEWGAGESTKAMS